MKRTAKVRRFLAAVALALPLAAQADEYKVIGDFETDEEVAKWEAIHCVSEKVAENATTGKSAVRVDFYGNTADSWPGLRLKLPAADRDWSNVVAVELDAAKATPPGQPLYVQLLDGDKKNTIMTGYVSPGKPKTYRYLLPRDKKIDVKNIVAVFIYRSSPREDYSIFLDNVRVRSKSSSSTKPAQ